jgi:thiamine biosynthesis lipoprotein
MTQPTATSIAVTRRPERTRRVEHCMGTVFSIDVRSPGCDPAAVEDAVRWLHWVDATFSTYQPDSQISRLSRGELDLADCAPEVAEILTRCRQLETETDGYFSAYATGRLDPSGLVKGWAIQHASDRLSSAGSRNHCVNGGGDVHCAGSAADGEPWRVGITDPHRPGQLAAVVTGIDIAVATSGIAERGSHIINPHERTSPAELASVTIIGKDLARVDAYATAAFAMGHQAPDWIADLDADQGLVIRADGSQWSST